MNRHDSKNVAISVTGRKVPPFSYPTYPWFSNLNVCKPLVWSLRKHLGKKPAFSSMNSFKSCKLQELLKFLFKRGKLPCPLHSSLPLKLLPLHQCSEIVGYFWKVTWSNSQSEVFIENILGNNSSSTKSMLACEEVIWELPSLSPETAP